MTATCTFTRSGTTDCLRCNDTGLPRASDGRTRNFAARTLTSMTALDRVAGHINIPSDSGRVHDTIHFLCAKIPPGTAPAGSVVYFPGDNVLHAQEWDPVHHEPILRLSDPDCVAQLLASKFSPHQDPAAPGVDVWVVLPSRYDGDIWACYEHLLPSLTKSGDPLGYKPASLPAARHLVTILQAAYLHVRPPACPLVAESPAPSPTLEGGHDQAPKLSSSHPCDKPNVYKAQPHADEPQGESQQPPPGNLSHREPGSPQASSTQQRQLAHPPSADGSTSSCSPPTYSSHYPSPWELPPPVTLVGHSKGGIVLNQLLSEMASGGADVLASAASFLSSVTSLHWVDAGLNCRGVFVTDPAVLAQVGDGRPPTLAPVAVHPLPPGVHPSALPAVANTQGEGGTRVSSDGTRGHSEGTSAPHREGGGGHGGGSLRPPARLYLHGTPRSWEDRRRPWIPEEKRRFVAHLRDHGVPVWEKLYFTGQPASMTMHFAVLDEMVVEEAGGGGGVYPRHEARGEVLLHVIYMHCFPCIMCRRGIVEFVLL
eukprot:jgi/Mesvir1/29443/Mv23023-RA.1